MMHPLEQSSLATPRSLAAARRPPRVRRAGGVALAVGVCTLAPLGTVSGAAPPAIDFWWDWSMVVGMVAAGLLGLMPLLSARWWSASQPHPLRLRFIQRLHADLAYVLLVLLLLHAAGLIVLEPRIIGYLKLQAPWSMLGALAALLAVIVLIVSSIWRRRWLHGPWRRWHAWLSLFAIAFTAWHLLGSGYYFATAGTITGLIWLLCAPAGYTLLARRWPAHRAHWAHWARRPRGARSGAARPGSELASRRTALLLGVMWLLAAAVYAWPTARPAEPDPYQCPVARCL